MYQHNEFVTKGSNLLHPFQGLFLFHDFRMCGRLRNIFGLCLFGFVSQKHTLLQGAIPFFDKYLSEGVASAAGILETIISVYRIYIRS